MTLPKKNLSYGPPPPITKLTMEQDLKLRVLHDKLVEGYATKKEDVITLLIALQHQNFVMANSIENLIHNWPNENHLFILSSEGIPQEIQIKEQPRKANN